MTRYWVSWWSGYYKSEGCSEPPFQIWTSGERSRHDGKTELSLCAVIDAENEDEITASLDDHFPDYEVRFIQIVDDDFQPGDRFPDFENRTSIEEQ